MEDELLKLLEEYLADCEKWPVKTGFMRMIKCNDDDTYISKEIITNGIEPTFPGFIAWLRSKDNK